MKFFNIVFFTVILCVSGAPQQSEFPDKYDTKSLSGTYAAVSLRQSPSETTCDKTNGSQTRTVHLDGFHFGIPCEYLGRPTAVCGRQVKVKNPLNGKVSKGIVTDRIRSHFDRGCDSSSSGSLVNLSSQMFKDLNITMERILPPKVLVEVAGKDGIFRVL